MNKLLLSILLILFSHISLAQDAAKGDDSGDEYDGKAYFMTGINYVSDNVYLGRKDTLPLPYISPNLGYQFKSGIFLKATGSFATRPGTHLDLLTLCAGYQHQFGDHFLTGAEFDQFNYNKNTVSVKANIKSTAEVYAMYANDWIEPTFISDINFIKSNKADFVVGVSLDHTFELVDNKLNIVPIITFMSGTQHYYEQYKQSVENKKGKIVKRNKIVDNSDKFVPLDYEFALLAQFTIHHWLLKLIPTYVIPQSPSTLTINNRPHPEKLSNTFFLELDICYRY